MGTRFCGDMCGRLCGFREPSTLAPPLPYPLLDPVSLVDEPECKSNVGLLRETKVIPIERLYFYPL